jgi:mono/diheme cytochrome c family protein
MKKITKVILGIGVLGGAAMAGLFGYVLYDGPRMKSQPHLRAYQWVMALPPAGAVPVGESPYAAAGLTATRLPPAGSGSVKRGAVYYSYYCLSCHGETGRGDGPVGQSYYPVPTDLAVLRLPPSALHRAMLTGTGHAPVLERVVRPEYRWDLVAYLQTLKK